MIGRNLGERYTVLEEVSGGGMAVVYKARCNLLNRIVAIKVLKSEFSSDEDFVRRFRREAQAAASLSHPNIVGIYDVGQEDGLHYIVMEYVEGYTLKEVIRQRAPMPLSDVIEIGIQICDALECAHKNKIVHRDIKSQNIMLTSDGRVKVTDFGIARATSGTTITNTGNAFGSVQYFSPEQARGDLVDERSDIYSVGIVLYEAFTGKLPFDGQTPVSIALKQIQERQEPIYHIIPGFPRELEAIVEKCLAKSQDDRYQSAKELRQDLEAMAKDPEVQDFKPLDLEQTMLLEDINNTVKIKAPVKKGNKKRKVFRGIGIALALLIAFGVFSYLGGMLARKYLEVPEVTVPDVIGFTEADAMEEMQKNQLKAEVVDRIHDVAPAGQVIDQEPKGNQRVKIKHPSVKLVVSKGPKAGVVPNIIGRTEQEGIALLESNGFTFGRISKENSKDVPEGIIIDQNPRADLSLTEGTPINFTVSLGPDMVNVPMLIGKSLDEAKRILQNQKISLGKVDPKPSNVSENTVIEQSPNSGELLEPGAKVNLVVSSGPSKTKEFKIEGILLPSEPEEFTIKVIISDDLGKDRLVYSEKHTPEDSPFSIDVEGAGKMDVEIWLDDILLFKRDY